MEIVLQWLDDLDDAVFAVVLAWERLRPLCIGIGAASAVALAASAIVASHLVLPFAAVAAGSVSFGLLGATLAAVAETRSAVPRRA